MKKNMVRIFTLDEMSGEDLAALLHYITQTIELYTVYQREIFHADVLKIVESSDENLATFLRFLQTNKLLKKSDLMQIKKDILAVGNYVQYTLGGDANIVSTQEKDILATHKHPSITAKKELPGFSALMRDKLYMRNIDRDLNLLLY